MVLNPDSGAYGLNLQHCSLMYFYSRNFSYAKNVQLEKRIHRPGQKFNCIYLISNIELKSHLASFEDMTIKLTLKDILN